jgi:hypothetical protein
MKPLAETIQRVSNSTAEVSTAPSHVENGINSSRGGGSVMDQSTRNFMETRFGTNFSGVRIHTGSEAIQMSRELNAQAFTVGNDIYFNQGKYSPNTDNGKHLLAHELTHTIQQGGGIGRKVQRITDEQLEFRHNRFPAPNPTDPIDINAVNGAEETSMSWYFPPRYTGPVTSFLRGDVNMTSLSNMVTNILAFAGTHQIRRLNIMDHGNSSGIQIGSDWITSSNFSSFSAEFNRLRGHFSSSGFIHLNQCEAGASQNLVCLIAQATGVTVYGQNGLYNPIYRMTLGDYVSCTPSGTFNSHANRPW